MEHGSAEPSGPWVLPGLRRTHTLGWIGFWLVLTAFLFQFDGPIVTWADNFRLSSFPNGRPPWLLQHGLEVYGTAAGTALAAVGVYLRDLRSPARALALVLVTLSVGGVVNVMKGLIGRVRPASIEMRVEGFDTLFVGPRQGFSDADYRSFPSGHTAAAASNTFVLNAYHPRLAPLTWALTLGVASERVFDCKHFPSDTASAVLVSWILSQWLLRRSRFQRLCELLVRERRGLGAHAGGELDA